jgi:hypothetical protein
MAIRIPSDRSPRGLQTKLLCIFVVLYERHDRPIVNFYYISLSSVSKSQSSLLCNNSYAFHPFLVFSTQLKYSSDSNTEMCWAVTILYTHFSVAYSSPCCCGNFSDSRVGRVVRIRQGLHLLCKLCPQFAEYSTWQRVVGLQLQTFTLRPPNQT